MISVWNQFARREFTFYNLVVDWSKRRNGMSIGSSGSIGAYEAKTHLAELLEKVESGQEITITRHGTPVARLVPAKKKTTTEERIAAIQCIRELSKGLSLGGLKMKDLISEGRK
jgi:prevent-host-death family protein